MWNTVVSSTDFNLATKRVATKRSKQAVAEPLMAGLEKFQARLDEITTKPDGTKKDVSDRRDMMMKRDVSTSVAEMEKPIKSRRRQQGSLESMDRRGVQSTPRDPGTSQL